MFELARLEESQSRPEGALAHYQELIKTYPNSPFTSEATIRTKVLDVKSKEPSAPPPAPAPPTKPKKQYFHPSGLRAVGANIFSAG